MRNRALRACSLLVPTVVLALAAPVAAQDRPAAALLQATRSSGIEEGTAGAYDRMVRQRLDGLGVVRVSGSVALDLEQLQLALGCMGETVACLEAVSNEVGAPIVLVPSLDRAGGELVAAVLLFDARDGAQRRAVRQARGATAEAEILQGVDGMLRELFGLPPARETGTGSGTGTGTGTGTGAGDTGRSISAVPFVVMGAGAAALVVGGVLGAMSQSSADTYRRTEVVTQADADAARAHLSRAETEALAANVLFVAGGVVAAAGLVWLLAGGNEDGSSPLAAAPMIGPDGAGVVIAGTFGGSP